MAHPIDLHVGQRLRQRRCLLGMTQQRLAEAVGIKFQQIQKYESGANRVSASRLWALANALEVSVSYFFDDLSQTKPNGSFAHSAAGGLAEDQAALIEPEVLSEKETIDLVRAYYGLSEEPRRRLLDLAKTLAGAA
ncbi:helix-turn-helix transcriptional regulator [Parvularcula flava]|uniref:Transcriptional regulator n=1 Tax=Aquisalinus luteolus TaxID=1566827 RepID=A0A8J3ERN3_9PROT|nr:helix-turn-helix transcriptional regulator [Aquisalinus luteolus]NHK28793.1 helix-turn-helix transcriptional regulator [Aquisalinus luteolus]GGH99534.1 transcriptional regulator [Aquisalinus luteolus]